MTFFDTVNLQVARSPVGKYFQLEGSTHRRARPGTSFFTEIRAGLATFFAMAYIISVNAAIVSQTGGTCKCPAESMADLCKTNTEYLLCKQEIQRDLVTATAAIAALTTFCMGAFANMPIALAPGMGLNAYFTFTVVGFHGSGLVPYEVALTAVFVEGLVFFGLTLLGIRQWLARAIPHSIKLATGVGIGLFLTIIGLTYSAGIGLITGAIDTPLDLAGCAPQFRDADTGLCPPSEKMRSGRMWLGIFLSGIMVVVLQIYRVKGAIIMGIFLVSIISWPRPTSVTNFPYTPLGDDAFNFFKKVATFHPIRNILAVQRWDVSEYSGQFGLAFITFLYVDILDTTGTLYAMARFAGRMNEKTGDFENSSIAYSVDALGITIGSLFGTPPVTAYVESGAGIAEGGQTGLTAITTGLCFFVALFFAPIFASIPVWATGPILVLVGALMCRAAAEINWRYLGDAVPAFITIAVMPFTYSIAYGLIGGICSYICINTIIWLIKVASKGKIVPHNYAEKDPWTYKIPGGFFPPYLQRIMAGKRDFWRDYPEEMEGEEGVDRKSSGSGSADSPEAIAVEMEKARRDSEIPGLPTETVEEKVMNRTFH